MRAFFCLLGAVLVALLACRIGFADDAPVHPSHEQSDAVAVDVVVVGTMDIPQLVYSVGTTIALKQVNISSEIDGRVKKIFYKDGDFVSKGLTIIALDNVQANANVQSAKAALSLSRTTYERKLAAFNDGGISAEDLDTAKADVESKSAALQASEAALAQTVITAPFAGVLGAFTVSSGDFISKGNVLVPLVDKHQLKVDYTVPENELGKVQLGQTTQITISAYPKKVFSGKVTFVSPAVDKQSASLAVHATIDNKSGLLSPGMFAHVKLFTGVDRGAVVLPEQAVLASLQGNYVFVVNDKQHAVRTPVTTGAHYQGKVEITQGLSAGSRVVTAGQQKLHSGSVVNVLKTDTYLPSAVADKSKTQQP